VIPNRLDGGNHPFRATSLEGKSHQRTHLKSQKLFSLLYRKRHSHGRHETGNGTVVHGHGTRALVYRYHAALSLETGLGVPGDHGQM
jgi:hypothetical protein